MPEPKIPEILESEVTGVIASYDFRFLAEMGETHAKAIMEQAKATVDVAKNTHAIPARHETYRYFGGLVFVALLVWKLLPLFSAANPTATTIAFVIVGTLAIVGGKPLIEAVSKAIRGS